jgi:hypothetical protein
MEISEAVAIINRMVYRPGYCIHAVDSTRRYERSVNVRIEFETRDSGTVDNPHEWLGGYPTKVVSAAAFTVMITEKATVTDLYKMIGEVIILAETHEMREFLRNPFTGEAPLHPHTQAGIAAWGTPEIDRTYGLNALREDES